MAGIRYDGWKHTRVDGNPADASSYLPAARKLLGQVYDDAGHNNLGSHKMVEELEDGTVIVAEKIGAQPRITIRPSDKNLVVNRLRPPEDFVVFARTEALPNGIDDDYPQQILRPKKEVGSPPTWKTFFYSDSTYGYADFDLPKGSYVGLFPSGITHAGNLDWCGENGERVSWGGPSTRYFLDPYTQPSAQYGKKVFMLGQVLLDLPAYIASIELPETTFAEEWVLGAALRQVSGVWYLYVVHSFIYDEVTSTGTTPFNINFDVPYPVGDITTVLSRFTLLKDDSQPVAEQYTVAVGSRVELYRGDLYNANTPWFFSQDATLAIAFAMPTHTAVALDDGAVIAPPATSQLVHQLTMPLPTVADYSSSTVSLGVATTEDTAATVAVDFGKDFAPLQLVMKRTPRGSTLFDVHPKFSLSFKGTDYLLNYDYLRNDGSGIYDSMRRNLMWADLRSDTFVFVRADIETDTTFTTNAVQVELWRDGVRQATVDVDPADYNACGLGYKPLSESYSDAVRTVALAPCFPLYAICYGSEALTARFIRWEGGHAIYRYRPYPPGRHYGAYANSGTLPAPWTPMTTEGEFDGNQLSADGKYSVLGAASYEGVSMLSCYGFTDGGGISLQWVDGSTMQDLTGVTGAKNRYHPIWLLGKPPGGFA